MIVVIERDPHYPAIYRFRGVKEYPNERTPTLQEFFDIVNNAKANLKRIEDVQFGELGKNRKDD